MAKPDIDNLENWDIPTLIAQKDNVIAYGEDVHKIKEELSRREEKAAQLADYRHEGRLSEERELAAKGNLLRLVILGNSGGVIATLSFIGTMIGRSENQTFDIQALFVLGLFLLGLFFGFLGRYVEYKIAALGRLIHDNSDDAETISKWIKTRADISENFLPVISLCSALFAGGTGFGLFILWGMGQSFH